MYFNNQVYEPTMLHKKLIKHFQRNAKQFRKFILVIVFIQNFPTL